MSIRSKSRLSSPHPCHYLEFLESRTLLAADLAVTILNVTCPSILVPGDKGSIKVQVSNVGDSSALGLMDVGVYATIDMAFNVGDVKVASRDRISLNMAPHKSITLTLPLAITSEIQPGTYHVLAGEIAAILGTDANSANNLTVTPETRDLSWQFGTVGNRKNVALTLLDGVNPVKFSMSGVGTGQIDNPGSVISSLNVSVSNSTNSSNLTISTPSKTFTAINRIAVSGSIGKIAAASTNLESGISVTGLASSIAVHDIQSIMHKITLNSAALPVPTSAALTIAANVINGCTVDTGGIPIKTFTAAQVSGAEITTPWIGSLTTASKLPGEGNFSGNLTLNGPNGNNGVSLSKFQVSGTMANTNITANSDVKSIAATQWVGGSVSSDDLGTVTIKGDMHADVTTDGFASAAVTGDCSGAWNTKSIGKVQVGGDLSNATLSARSVDQLTVKGWLDSSKVLADIGIGVVTLGGMQDSQLFAGVNIKDRPDSSSDFDTANPGSIGSVLVNGLKDGNGQWIDSLINTSIAAWTVGKITLANMQQNNAGVLFGVTAHSVGKYLLMHDGREHTNGDWVGSSDPLEATVVHGVGDYRVIIVGGP